jgi:hypothetical protein
MRRSFLTLATTFVLVALAAPADAQFSFGGQGAVITGVDDLGTISPGAPDLNNTFGFGARAVFQAPVLPIGLVAQGIYYFPDADDYDYRTYGLAARFRLSIPVISPYALGGWQWRRVSTGGASNTESGAMFGVGVELNLGISLFLEGTYEFTEELPGNPDFSNSPIVIKGGIMFG